MNARAFLLVVAALGLACGPAAEAPPAETSEPAAMKVERKLIYPAQFAEGKSYTPGVLAGDTLYLAGMIDLDPKTGQQPEGVEAQTKMAMDSIGHVLEAADMTYSNLVSCHVMLDDMENYKAMNAVYGSYYEEGKYPARTTLEMPSLVAGAHVEISCIGYRNAAEIQYIHAAEGRTPPAMGPYSPGVMAGGTLYISGQGGRDPKTNEVAEKVGDQTARTLESIQAILEAAGLDFKNVVFTNVYYLGPENRAGVDEAYMKPFMEGGAPSRGAFCLSRLPGTISVEITFLAAKDNYITRLYPHDEQPGATSSPASLTGDTLYVSAHAAPEAGETLEAQFRAILEEQKARLELASMGLENVVDAKVYLADSNDFKAMDALFKEYFPNNPPARTTVGVREEADRAGTKLEIAFIAVK
ncbi:MAG: hypothetical protein GC160_16430 [Acidobacteria bacterium]|nr:hypothetical protein [Acidobacteriota bacterium]